MSVPDGVRFVFIWFLFCCSSACQSVVSCWRCQFFNCYTFSLPLLLRPNRSNTQTTIISQIVFSFLLFFSFIQPLALPIAWCVLFLVWFGLVWLMSFFFLCISVIIHLVGCFHLYYFIYFSRSIPLSLSLSRSCFCLVVLLFLILMFCAKFLIFHDMIPRL